MSLSVSKLLVELMGGTVSIENNSAQATQLTMSFKTSYLTADP